MSALEAPRGLVRAALAAVLPHTGRESEETPALGRVRLVATGDGLLVWATDHRSSALARVEHPEFTGDELPSWDMPAAAVKKVLQVFRGPTNADERAMWDDQPMRVELSERLVTFTEVGSIVDGQSLSVARVVPAGDDTYPDVPRELVTLAAAVLDEPAPTMRVNLDVLVRFAAAAKAYSGDVPIARLTPGHVTHRVLVRIGRAFVGSAPAYLDQRQTRADVRNDQILEHAWWSEHLTPLMRPVPIKVAPGTSDDLARQAEAIFRTAGPDVTLRVVPTEPLP